MLLNDSIRADRGESFACVILNSSLVNEWTHADSTPDMLWSVRLVIRVDEAKLMGESLENPSVWISKD